MQLIASQVLGTQSFRGAGERWEVLLSKLADGVEIAADGGLRIVAPLQFFQHALAKWGHRNLLPMTTHPKRRDSLP